MVSHDLHKFHQNQVSMIFIMLRRDVLHSGFVGVVVLMLGGCGFHLERLETLPNAMTLTYLESDKSYTDFYISMRNALRTNGSSLVSSPGEAGAVLKILDDSTGQRVLSVSARNTPREYEVFYAVTFSLQVGAQSLIPSESLIVTRSYTYDETRVLGKSAEERDLRRALADDLVRQVLRRIQVIHPRSPSG